MSLDKLKLNKRLYTSMTELGYLTAKEMQSRALSRIIGGQDIIGIGPEGSGKTTTYVLGVLMRLKYTTDDAPKVLILAPNQERITEIVDRFISISKNKNLHIMGLKTSGGMEEEIEELVLGVDIVVATPNRARAVYLKLGLNLNRIQTFIVDDAEEIIKQGMQTPVRELAQSCGKVQYLAFSTVEHEKLHLMLDPFMPFPTIIEVEELGESMAETHEMLLYQVPNYTTKVNLLNLLLNDEEVFDKVIVFVNNRLTAQKLFQSIYSKPETNKAILHPLFFDQQGFDNIDDFKQASDCRILIVANEGITQLDLSGIPFIIHLELPEDNNTFLDRMVKIHDEEVIAITFATDIELPAVKKIEQSLGNKIPVMPLPENLVVYNPHSADKKSEKIVIDESQGGAFHKKKESNSKTYNYGGGTKAKMTMKRKKG